MGVFPLVARVGCLRGGAIRLLEEWSPIPARGGQNPAYRPSGIFSFSGSLCGPEKEVVCAARVTLRAGLRVRMRGGRAGPLPHHEAGVGSPGANLGPRSSPRWHLRWEIGWGSGPQQL